MLPKAYIKGHQEFYKRKFQVDKRTYVPNKETENLVYEILKEIDDSQIVIDVGTGCGNIAITLKLEKQTLKVFACDISKDALEVAKGNVKKFNVDVKTLLSNFVDNKKLPCPDFIIADLPWGSPEIVLHEGGMEMLKHMPQISLFHSDGPLGAQIELFKSIAKRKWKPKVFIETGLLLKEEVAKIIPKNVEWEYRKIKKYSMAILQF